MCNQGVLNYLLIALRRDKDLVKFWKVVKLMINQPEMRNAIEPVQKGIYMCNANELCMCAQFISLLSSKYIVVSFLIK